MRNLKVTVVDSSSVEEYLMAKKRDAELKEISSKKQAERLICEAFDRMTIENEDFDENFCSGCNNEIHDDKGHAVDCWFGRAAIWMKEHELSGYDD